MVAVSATSLNFNHMNHDAQYLRMIFEIAPWLLKFWTVIHFTDLQQIWSSEIYLREGVLPTANEWEELKNRLDVAEVENTQEVIK